MYFPNLLETVDIFGYLDSDVFFVRYSTEL